MADYLFRNCAAIVTGTEVLRNVDLLTDGQAISAIGPAITPPDGTEVIDASGWFLYPGLVNTHHHFFQPTFPK